MKKLEDYLYYEEKDPDLNIYLGDCLEIMPLLPKVDLVLTDPPYGIKMDKGFKGFEGFGGFGKPIARKRYEDDNWDSSRPSQDHFKAMLEKSDLCLIWGGNFFADYLPQSKHWIVWDKLNTMPSFGDCELAWTNSNRNSVKKITIEYNGLLGKEKVRLHPTQKPVSLLSYCIVNYSESFDTILDPFLGSGTTLVACKELNRNGIGIEINESYCRIAKKRLQATTKSLFASPSFQKTNDQENGEHRDLFSA